MISMDMELQRQALIARINRAPREHKAAWRKALREHAAKQLANETRLGTTAGNGAGFSLAASAATSGDGSPDVPSPIFFPWLQGEGPYRLRNVDWRAVADGRQL